MDILVEKPLLEPFGSTFKVEAMVYTVKTTRSTGGLSCSKWSHLH